MMLNRCKCDAETCRTGHTALQYACLFNPPIDVVRCLYYADPQAIRHKDCQGNYPLHSACSNGCSPEVIQFLVSASPQAAGNMNKEDRNPALLACQKYLSSFNQKNKGVGNKKLLQILQILCAVAPMSFLHEDLDGLSHLDFLLEQEADLSVIRYVQLVSLKLRRQMDKAKPDLSRGISDLSLDGYLDKREQGVSSTSLPTTKTTSIIHPARAA